MKNLCRFYYWTIAIVGISSILIGCNSNDLSVFDETRLLTGIHPTEGPSTSTLGASTLEVPQNNYLDHDKPICIELSDNSLNSVDVDGSILLDKDMDYGFIYDLESKSSIPIREKHYSLKISPGFSRIALQDFTTNMVSILNPSGEIISSFEFKKSNLANWIGENKLLFFTYDTDPIRAIVYNVLTNKTKIIPLEFPNISMEYWQPGNNWYSIFGYDQNRLVLHPSLDFVLFPSVDNPLDSAGNLVFWNLREGNKISEIIGIAAHTTMPEWSPDDNSFAVEVLSNQTIENLSDGQSRKIDSIKGNLIQVDINGNITKLTEFQTSVNFFHLSWSPNGTKIAFWINDWASTPPINQLGILDVITKELSSFCIQGYGKIHWSPNGRFLLLNVSKYPGQYEVPSTTIPTLVSMSEGWAISLFDGVEAVGWLVSGKE
jgi:hypothetical protein